MDAEKDESTLDALLSDAARTYRVPPAPPLDAIWSQVEARAFVMTPTRQGRFAWRTLGLAMAASLLIGVAVGRVSARGDRVATETTVVAGRPPAQSPVSQAKTAAEPYQRATEEFLGSTALLLAALPRTGSADRTSTLLPEQATQLLTTTRLLLDSPVGANPRMKALLQDLELVLAQVARLQPRRESAELTMISQTLEERDLVPRIRSAVTDLSAFDY
ncbi:MAG TPA: hypothetical protein VHE78_01925 [Gemmatimonadaceae bacterium]|nr:hypothetical protein [Gemmatimonadaceae bacterium]